MASFPRGRGYAISTTQNKSSGLEIRRPGEIGLRQRFSNGTSSQVKPTSPTAENRNVPEPVRSLSGPTSPITAPPVDSISILCDRIGNLSMADSEPALQACTEELKSICSSSQLLHNCIDRMFQFARKSKWNSHTFALFVNYSGDLTVDEVKFRTLLLTKLQILYKERGKTYLEIDTFLMDATLMCEIFHHVRINGCCIKVLAAAILDYLGMLLEGSSQKEIEVFVEQFPKCFKNIKESDSSGLDAIVIKIRKQIVCDKTTVTVKAMLLEIFEFILLDWKPLSQNVRHLYDSYSKPIVRICE